MLSVDKQVDGQTEWQSGTGQVVRVQHEHWPHGDVPNGLAGARLETKIINRDQLRLKIITEYTVTDFGPGAITALTDKR